MSLILFFCVRVEFLLGLSDGVLGVVRSMYSRDGEWSFVGSCVFGHVLCWSMSLPDDVLSELFVSSACCNLSSGCSSGYLFTVEGSFEVLCTCVVMRVR